MLHSHRTLLADAQSIADLYRMRADVVYMPSPVGHVTGLVYGVLMPLLMGGSCVLQAEWDAGAGADLIERHGGTVCVGATPFLRGLTDEYRRRGQRSALRAFICGGADVPPSLVRDSNLQGSKIYIDFEDIKIQEVGSESFQVIEKIATEIHEKKSLRNEAEQIYYFLDEIHNIPGWESWVDRLNRQGAKIFITSSCSGLKEQEFSTRFKGRSKIIRLFPFSFKEYILLRGTTIPGFKFLTPSQNDEMLCMFLQYFENGGFPAVIRNNDFHLCREYFEEILQKKAVKACDTQVISGLKKLSIFLISNVASECRLETLKKACGIEDEEIICTCLDYLEDNFLLYRIQKLMPPHKSSLEMAVKYKFYVSDTGFFKAVCPNYPDNLGLRFENLVYLELLRQGKQIFYLRNMNECDFLRKEKDSGKISAAIRDLGHLGSQVVRERQFSDLWKLWKIMGLKKD